MAKINRYNGDLPAFADQAQGTERTVFGSTTQDDTLDANITADFQRGWGIVGVNENPTKQDFNGLAYTLSQLLAYLHQMGVPEWNASQEYFTGSVVVQNQDIFQLKSGGDGSVSPTADDGTNWDSILMSSDFDVVTPQQFGAVADGVTDDTTAIQSALDAGASKVFFPAGNYLFGSTLNAPNDITLESDGGTLTASSSIVGLELGANVTIRRLKLSGGIAAGVYDAASTAIRCFGANNDPSPPTYVQGPTIEDCEIEGWGNYGVFLGYTKNSTVRNSYIHDVGYTGVGGVSCDDAIITENRIFDVTPGSPGGDAYGAFVDRNNGTSEAAFPRSYRANISNNIVRRVASTTTNNGQGIDTHAGVDFVIDGNLIEDCQAGVFLTSSTISGLQELGPKNCVVSNNVIRSSNPAGYGIVVYGARQGTSLIDSAEGCVVTGNIIEGFGQEDQTTVGATLLSYTRDLVVTGNRFNESFGSSIYLDVNNIGFSVVGNTFKNWNSDTFANTTGIYVYGNDNRGLIGGNTFIYLASVTNTYVAVNAIYANASLTGLDINCDLCQFVGIDSTHLSVDFNGNAGVDFSGLAKASGSGTITLNTGINDGITDVVFSKRMPYAPEHIFLTQRRPFGGGKPAVVYVDTSTAPTETGFRIYANSADGSNWSSAGTLDFDYVAS